MYGNQSSSSKNASAHTSMPLTLIFTSIVSLDFSINFSNPFSLNNAEKASSLMISLSFYPKYFFFSEVFSFSISYFACFFENSFNSRSYLRSELLSHHAKTLANSDLAVPVKTAFMMVE